MTKSTSDNLVRLLICGDTVPTSGNFHAFERGDAEQLVGADLSARLQGADLVVANLETPLADRSTPIVKNGPNLVAPTTTVRGISALGIDVVSLANNHVMDQGGEGLASTLSALESYGIRYFGAGDNLAMASEPFIFESHGIRVGIYACAEHEFSIADASSPGANPFDPLYSLDHVAELKASCDFVVVLYHGGKEHYRYPSPCLMGVCRRLAEKGANLVVCQHSHCIGCMEEWAGSTIVYGQGNFLFDHSESEFWQTGLLLEIEVGNGGYSVGYVPLRKDGSRVWAARGTDAEDILRGFGERSRQILDPGFVEAEYGEFAQGNLGSFIRAFVPGSRTLAFRALNRLSGGRLTKTIMKRMDCLAALNYMQCEAHRELFAAGLKGTSVGR